MKVLVVEGISGISQVLSSFLKLVGHAVDEADNGREAMRQIQAAGMISSSQIRKSSALTAPNSADSSNRTIKTFS